MTEDLHQLAAAYALDALDDAERQAFEAHYKDCPTCVVEVEEFRAVAGGLAETAATPPPDQLRSSVMAAISATPQEGTTPALAESSRSAQSWLAAAAVVVLLALGAIGWSLLDRDPNVDQVANAPDAVAVALAGSTSEQTAELEIVWSDARGQVAVIASGLDELPDGVAYALWFITDGGVVPAALFRPDGGEIRTVLDVDDVDAAGWGITIEPDTGSPQPTSPVIYSAVL